MSFGMFARSPFDIFDQSYGCQSYDPWASELIHRPYYKRPYSGRRYIHPMWNFQPQMMSYDDDYYPVQSTETRRKPRTKKQHNGPKIQISSQPNKTHVKNECIEQADNKSNLMSSSLLSDVKDGKNDLQAHSTCENNFRDENDSDSEYQSAEEDFIPKENNQAACTEQLEENQPEIIQPDVKKTEASDTDNEDHGNKDGDDVSQEKHRKVSLDDVVQKRLGQINEQVEKAQEIATDPTYSQPNKTEKQKLYLTEMLLRCILNLDMIETQGYEHVRQKRKEAILDVQKLLDQVEG